MRKRLYFIVPSVSSARTIVDELLLSRIDVQHIHVLANENTSLGDLPEATLLQKSDIIHGVESGMVIGGITGLIGGIVAILALQPSTMMGLIVLGSTLFGAGFGIWMSGMIGSSTRNSRLKGFEQAIDNGNILIMADVPVHRVAEVAKKLESHKEVKAGGSEPSMPAFP